MKVSDLIKALEKCDQDALVCVEANSIPEAKTVVQYNYADGDKFVYICDETDYLDEVIIGGTKKKIII